MEPVTARVQAIVRRALDRLGTPPPGALTVHANPGELRIEGIDMPQLVRLVYLQAGDPLVDKVLASLKAGLPVYLDRPAIETTLGLAEYPPRLQEQFNRWFSRLAGYGIALVASHPAPPLSPVGNAPGPGPVSPVPLPPASLPCSAAPTQPEQAIFSEILGEAVPEPHPCVIDPSRACCGSGRCKTLGY